VPRLQRRGNFRNLVVVEVEPCNGRSGISVSAVFFQANGVTLAVKLHHSIALRVFYLIGEYGGALFELRRRLQLLRESLTVKNVRQESARSGWLPMIPCQMRNACARPSGLGCTAYSISMPHCLPSPSNSLKRGVSCGVRSTEPHAPGQHERGERVIDIGLL